MAVILIVICVTGIYIYSNLQKEAIENVEVSLSDIQVQSVGLTTAKLNLKLSIYNPNNIGVFLDRVNYTLYGNNIRIGSGLINERVSIPPKAAANISSLFEFSYSGAIQAVWNSLLTGERISWKVNGTAYIDTPVGSLSFPFSANISK